MNETAYICDAMIRLPSHMNQKLVYRFWENLIMIVIMLIISALIVYIS